MLHRAPREHLQTFLARVDEGPGRGLPAFVRRELYRYLGPSASCDVDGFSLHAKVEIEARDRDGLERSCRYLR